MVRQREKDLPGAFDCALRETGCALGVTALTQAAAEE